MPENLFKKKFPSDFFDKKKLKAIISYTANDDKDGLQEITMV